jgi:hypothetical protein
LSNDHPLEEDDMQVKTFSAVVFSLMGLVSIAARAEDAPAAPPAGAPAAAAPTDPTAAPPTAAATASATGAEASKMRLGLTLVPMPLGSLKGAGGTSLDTAFAFGVMPIFDYKVHPNFFVGVAPLYIFNVKGKDQMGDSASELDIQLRLGGGAPITDKIGAYGYLSPGYSIGMLPQAAKDLGASNPKGFMLGIHAGAMMDLASNIFVNAELGYQLGFQKASFMNVDGDAKSNFFQIGLGAGIHL